MPQMPPTPPLVPVPTTQPNNEGALKLRTHTHLTSSWYTV